MALAEPPPDAGIRHDLAHALATVRVLIGAAQAEQEAFQAQAPALLGTAEQELEYASSLVGVLAPTVQQAGSPADWPGDPAGESCDLTDVLRRAARALAPDGRSVTIEAPDELPAAMPATALNRVVRNLLGNALAAAGPEGNVLLRAATVEDGTTPSSSPNVRLEVHDDGPGPGGVGFSRVGGRGLDVVRSLVLPSGGWLVLGRSPWGGAYASVTLPGAHDEVGG
jgi:signal transduction histidine kinase